MPTYSQAFIDHMTAGPFPNRPDPWGEAGRFFHQLHGEIISHMLGQLRAPLLHMGYIAGRETSLQIAENRQPDLYIQRPTPPTEPAPPWSYAQAAQSIHAEPGVMLEAPAPELDALHIKDADSGRLVTVIEVISPRNKNDGVLIRDYQERRARLLRREVNVVEVDLTRSVKRLVADPLADTAPYHVAAHLYDQPPRLIGMALDAPLKRFAVPLRAAVTPIDLHPAYAHAYKRTSLAWHIDAETGYAASALPFPSLLTPDQHHNLTAAAAAWHIKRDQLR